MNSDVITVDKDMTVDEVVSFLRIKAETDKVELLYVYVTDKSGHLLGVLSLRSLFTTPPYVKVEDIMIKDLVKVTLMTIKKLQLKRYQNMEYWMYR